MHDRFDVVNPEVVLSLSLDSWPIPLPLRDRNGGPTADVPWWQFLYVDNFGNRLDNRKLRGHNRLHDRLDRSKLWNDQWL